MEFLTVTDMALTQLKEALSTEKDAKVGIRVGMSGGGCSGLKWVLDVEDNPKETDFSQVINGVTFYIDPMSAPYIRGTTLDYVKTFTTSGFKFTNNQVKRTCGCGSSVSY